MIMNKRQILGLVVLLTSLLVACKPELEESKKAYDKENSLSITHMKEEDKYQVEELNLREKIEAYDKDLRGSSIRILDVDGTDILLLVNEALSNESILKYKGSGDQVELVYNFSIGMEIIAGVSLEGRDFIIYSKGTNDEYFFGEIGRNEVFQLDEIRHLFSPNLDKTSSSVYYTNLTNHRASFLNTIRKYDLETGLIEEIYSLDKDNFIEGAGQGIVFNPVEAGYISFYSKEDKEITILGEDSSEFIIPSYLDEEIFSYTIVGDMVWVSLEATSDKLRFIDLKSKAENTIPYKKSYLYPSGDRIIGKTDKLALLSLNGDQFKEWPIRTEEFDSNLKINPNGIWNFYKENDQLIYRIK